MREHLQHKKQPVAKKIIHHTFSPNRHIHGFCCCCKNTLIFNIVVLIWFWKSNRIFWKQESFDFETNGQEIRSSRLWSFLYYVAAFEEVSHQSGCKYGLPLLQRWLLTVKTNWGENLAWEGGGILAPALPCILSALKCIEVQCTAAEF